MGIKRRLHRLGNVMRMAKAEYLSWITSSKILLLFFLFVYAKGQVTDSLLELTELTGKPLQICEPGVAFLGSSYMMMVLPLIYLVLMGDFPRNGGNKTFFIIRTGKGVWFLGQVLFAFMTVITTIVISVVAVTLPCIGHITWNNGNWSEAVTKYHLDEQLMDFKFNLITQREYNHMLPSPALLHSILLMGLCFMLMSVLQLLFSVWGKKILGLAFVGSMITISNALSFFENGKLMWYFPIANTQIWLRHDVILKEESVTMAYSYGYFGVCIILVLLLAWVVLKRSNVKIE